MIEKPMSRLDMPSNGSSAALAERVRSLRLSDRADGDASRAASAWLPWVLCLLLAASTGSLAYTVYTRPTEPSPVAAAPLADSPSGKVSGDTPRTSELSKPSNPNEPVLAQKGYVIPAHQIAVSPIEAAGQIIELRPNKNGREFGEGTHYEKGDPLAVLDSTPYEQEVREARASLLSSRVFLEELESGFRLQVEQAEAELREAQANRKQALLDYNRSREIRGGALATRDFEQAEAAYRSLEQKVNRLTASLELIKVTTPKKIEAQKAAVAAAEAKLKRSEWRLANCTIRAPISGTILTKKAELGNLINPLAFGATSGSLCEMADLADLEIDIEIQERDVSKVFRGQRCEVRVDAYPDRVYAGVVDRLMPIANRAKGAVPIRVRVEVPKGEEGQYLKPEMGAIVSFFGEQKP